MDVTRHSGLILQALGAVVHRGETAERAYALFRDISLEKAA